MNGKTLCWTAVALLGLFAPSCAPTSLELPSDQEKKVRLHRMTPEEEMEESELSRSGVPLPATRDASWKF